ncbi:FMN-dependent NADH-azoreductase [Erwinia sp. V71]|uniref:FMN-dependent NADH-azoreductase n=1 Tax=Erwinia sp. V71 TaxID=3369424 RepID=UPI003F60774C
MKLLHINASTREADSQSLTVAKLFIEELNKNTNLEIDIFNIFTDDLPEFDGLAVGAKMALFSGGNFTEDQKQVWERTKQVFDRFASADILVFNVPLWNNGIPYKLKQFIDVVTQPGWTFGFDPEKGYSGLLTGKKALVVHASGVYYNEIPAGFGTDFATPYLEDWLNFIGIDDMENIHVAPTVVNSDFATTKANAENNARDLAINWAKN